MKSFVKNLTLALTFCAVVSGSAFAGERSETVTFNRDVHVNGVLVKKGTYNVKFNDQNGEMTISRGKNEIVRATSRLEDRRSKADKDELIYKQINDEFQLRGLAFSGDKQNIVINEGAQAAAPNQ